MRDADKDVVRLRHMLNACDILVECFQTLGYGFE